jgi:putative salt-induced outer membrane protein YdiY
MISYTCDRSKGYASKSAVQAGLGTWIVNTSASSPLYTPVNQGVRYPGRVQA